MENTIFFGNKAETISVMKRTLTHKTQWCDYIDEVLTMINVNSVLGNYPLRTMNQVHFSLLICGISLTQDQDGAVLFFLSKKYLHIIHAINATKDTLRNLNIITSIEPKYLCPASMHCRFRSQY